MVEEKQSVGKCAELRAECHRVIFDKMDDLHQKQMAAISEVREDLAYQRGVQNGAKRDTETNPAIRSESPLKGFLGKALLSWGPGIGFLIVLGILAYLKQNGYL